MVTILKINDHFKQVVVDGCFSFPFKESLGGPQGSVFGPTLLLLYLNTVDEGVHSYIKLFADHCLIITQNHSDTT